MKTRIAVSLAAVMALALSAAAQAALPKTSDTLIVPAKSIGGVALGSSSAAVTKAWGKSKKCEFQCLYEGPKSTGETASLANVLLETKSTGATPTVWNMSMTVGEKQVGSTLKPNFDTPLTRFKTAKGIGLGSTTTELKQAYHAAKKVPGASTVYTLQGPKESQTVFSTSPAGRITAIGISSHPGG